MYWRHRHTQYKILLAVQLLKGCHSGHGVTLPTSGNVPLQTPVRALPTARAPTAGRRERVTRGLVTVHGLAFDPSPTERPRPHVWVHRALAQHWLWASTGIPTWCPLCFSPVRWGSLHVPTAGSWHRAGHTPRHPVPSPSSAGCWSTHRAQHPWGWHCRHLPGGATHGNSPGQRQEHDPDGSVPGTSPGPEAGVVKGPV